MNLVILIVLLILDGTDLQHDRGWKTVLAFALLVILTIRELNLLHKHGSEA